MTVNIAQPLQLSGACLTGVRFDIPVPAVTLQALLRTRGALTLVQLPECEPGFHLVSYEVWNVTDGRIMLAGVDQRDVLNSLTNLWRDNTRLALDLNNNLIGALTRGSSLFGSLTNLVYDGFGNSIERAAHAAGRLGRLLELPPYRELMVCVPNVQVDGAPLALTNAVLGMVTDSVLAREIDVQWSYGFGKRVGLIRESQPDTWSITLGTSPVLDVKYVHDQTREHSPDGALTQLDARLAQPLLGGLRSGRLRWCRFERPVERTAWHEFAGEVRLHPGPFAPEWFGDYQLRGTNFAFAFTNQRSCISRPVAI